MAIAVARPQPGAPIGLTCQGPRLKPWMKAMLSGTFTSKPLICSSMIAFGRETATVKPRKAVKNSVAGRLSASAHK